MNRFGPPVFHHPWWVATGRVIPLLLLVAILAVGVWALVALTRRRPAATGPGWPRPPPRASSTPPSSTSGFGTRGASSTARITCDCCRTCRVPGPARGRSGSAEQREVR